MTHYTDAKIPVYPRIFRLNKQLDFSMGFLTTFESRSKKSSFFSRNLNCKCDNNEKNHKMYVYDICISNSERGLIDLRYVRNSILV